MKKIVSVWILALATLLLQAQNRIKVPYGSASVMIDGKFEAAEWKDARLLKITDSLELYLKQDSQNIYWCLRGLYQPPVMGGVNFYLLHGDSLLNLHASAKLGERTLRDGSYGDWRWWNNESWTATVARPNKIEDRKFLRDEAKEFQLRKSRFTEKTLRLMLDVEFPKDLLSAYPEQAVTTSPDRWLWLEL